MQMDLILTEKALCLKEHEYFLLWHRRFLGFISRLHPVMYFHQIPASFVFCFWIVSFFPLMVHLVKEPGALYNTITIKRKKNRSSCIPFKNLPSLILCSYPKTPLSMWAFLLWGPHLQWRQDTSLTWLSSRRKQNVQKAPLSKIPHPAEFPQELKRKFRHKAIEIFHSSLTSTSTYLWFSSLICFPKRCKRMNEVRGLPEFTPLQ